MFENWDVGYRFSIEGVNCTFTTTHIRSGQRGIGQVDSKYGLSVSPGPKYLEVTGKGKVYTHLPIGSRVKVTREDCPECTEYMKILAFDPSYEGSNATIILVP